VGRQGYGSGDGGEGLLGAREPVLRSEVLHVGADVSAGLPAPLPPEAVREAGPAPKTVDERPLGQAGRRGWLIRRMLLIADVVGLLAAFGLASLLFEADGDEVRGHAPPLSETLLFVATLPAWIVFAKLYHLYDRDEQRTDHTTSDDIVGVFHLITMGSWVFFATAWLTDLAQPDLPKLFTFWALGITLVPLARAGARALCRRRPSYLQNTVIVGAGEVGQLVAKKLLQHPEYGINLIGFIDSDPRERREDLAELNLLGNLDRLPELVREHHVERVIVAFSGDPPIETLHMIRTLNESWVQIDIVPRMFEVVSPNVGIHTVEGLPLVGLPPFRLTGSARLLKRTLDISLSLLGLVVLAPLFAVVAIAIKRDSPGPVFFKQLRMGAQNKAFWIYKFRTMVQDADVRKAEVQHLNRHAAKGGDPRMFKVAGDPRITPVGRVLRRYLIDELPQLINVLKGDMSLVGPRPLILDEDRHVGGWARRRLDLKPGMTGLWQVLGRSDIPFDEMMKLDYLYVTSWSAWNDLCLLFRTLPLISNRNGKSY
jgi:exopolysaccharide biosynthesis polyprenyl glycosylphosphotransferase